MHRVETGLAGRDSPPLAGRDHALAHADTAVQRFEAQAVTMSARTTLLTALCVACSLAAAPARAAPRWGGLVEQDLGVLLMSGGVGVFAGVTRGPVRAALGFYRFDSPYRALGGVPDGFDLQVQGILSADVGIHLRGDDIEGPYVRAIVHGKRQRIENRDNGARRSLDSFLVGPEIGWTFRVHGGLYLAPRLGALYYVVAPQGRGGHPVDVGGKLYDNPRHKTFDVYGSLGIGYAF